MKGLLEKQIMLLMGTGSLVPPKTSVEMRDRITDILGKAIEIVGKARKEFPIPPYSDPESDVSAVEDWFKKMFGDENSARYRLQLCVEYEKRRFRLARGSHIVCSVLKIVFRCL